MSVEPNDPRLTALLLGELSETERAALEAKAAASPRLAEALAGLRQTADTVRRELAAEPCPHLTPAQREIVLREIAAVGKTGGLTSSGTWGTLLASVGWGSWGAWLALGTVALLLAGSVLAWQIGRRATPTKPADAVAAKTVPVAGTPQEVRPQPVPAAGRAVADLPSIVLEVGESVRLNVFGRMEGGREVRVAAGRLTWSAQPPAGYVRLDPHTLILHGLKPTTQPVLLTVHFDNLTARARVQVVGDGKGTTKGHE